MERCREEEENTLKTMQQLQGDNEKLKEERVK